MPRYITPWFKNMFVEEKAGHEKSTIAALDGVRACAILMVVAFHINWTDKIYEQLWDWQTNPLASSVAIAGGSGVTLFFVLSGFLLFLPYAKALLFGGRWPLARSFYVRRALRIMPGYYLSLCVLLLLTNLHYLQPDHWTHLTLFLTFFMDSSLLTFRAINGPYWTLAAEWQFYMLLPLLTLGILQFVRRVKFHHRLRTVTFCLLGVIVCGLLVRFCGLYMQSHPDETWLLPRPVIDLFLFFAFGVTGKYIESFAIGMLAALCYIYMQRLPSDHRFVTTLRRSSLWLWGGGLLVLTFFAMWHFQDVHVAWPLLAFLAPYSAWLSEMVLAIGFGMCILAILFGPRTLQSPFTWGPLRWIGHISYSLYIWHLPLLLLFHSRVLPLFTGAPVQLIYSLYWVWAAVVIVPFCFLYYTFIEKPGMRLGDRWRKKIEQAHRLQSAPQHQASEPQEERVRVAAGQASM